MASEYLVLIGNRYYSIHSEMVEQLAKHIEQGFAGCALIESILVNDLYGVISVASDEEIKNLPAYNHYLDKIMPYDAWGDADKVMEWRRKWKPLFLDQQ